MSTALAVLLVIVAITIIAIIIITRRQEKAGQQRAAAKAAADRAVENTPTRKPTARAHRDAAGRGPRAVRDREDTRRYNDQGVAVGDPLYVDTSMLAALELAGQDQGPAPEPLPDPPSAGSYDSSPSSSDSSPSGDGGTGSSSSDSGSSGGDSGGGGD